MKNLKKILVVDDREIGHTVLKDLIENPTHGVYKRVKCKMITAYSGKEAISLTKKENPDLILMDINMPEIDGFETTRRLKKSNKNLQIIAVTAQAMENDKEKCIQAGCDDYVSKPYDISHMINLMVNKLENTNKIVKS